MVSNNMSVGLHKFLPHHWLSRCIGWLADQRWGALKNWAISLFIQHYGVNMEEAEYSDYRQYATFNEFFTRRLKENARLIPEEPSVLISPVDGTVSELGEIKSGHLLQAKGKYYQLVDLLGGNPKYAELFDNGLFFTAYLAPKDYHRFHMPFTGRLLEMTHIPGRLFSVNAASVANIPNLFGRNERVVCLFDTSIGPMMVIAVGAMIVGGVATVWSGLVTPPTRPKPYRENYREKKIELKRGEELGYFKLGSTVILLFPKNSIGWKGGLSAGKELKMGEIIGSINPE